MADVGPVEKRSVPDPYRMRNLPTDSWRIELFPV